MFKRQERFQWPAHENLVQIPPDLPMKRSKRSVGQMFKAPKDGFASMFKNCSIHKAYDPACPWCIEATRQDRLNREASDRIDKLKMNRQYILDAFRKKQEENDRLDKLKKT